MVVDSSLLNRRETPFGMYGGSIKGAAIALAEQMLAQLTMRK